MAILSPRHPNGVANQDLLPPGVKIEVVLMTPERAAELLRVNDYNRKLNRRLRDQYKRDMTAHRFLFNGDAIRQDSDGNLRDGQHRLDACVASGVSFVTVLVTGLAPEVQHVIDRGRKRSLADDFSLQGVPNANTTATAVRIIANVHRHGEWKANVIIGGEPLSSGELHEEFNRDPHGFTEAGHHGARLRRLSLGPGLAAGLFYSFAEVHHGDAVEFYNRLFDPTLIGSNESSAAMVLRERLITIRLKRLPRDRLAADHVAALWIKAFNAWRRGDDMNQLKWSRGGARAEAFPQPGGDLIGETG